MDLATYLQGGGTVPGSSVPIAQQPQTLGSFQDAMRQWMMQRGQYMGSPQGVQQWVGMRPRPQSYGMSTIGDFMAQHPGHWHPSMMMAQRYQGGM